MKKLVAICLIFLFIFAGLTNATISASQPQSTPEGGSMSNADLEDPYRINETTSIKSDFYHLGIELLHEKYKNLEDILRSDLISMICLDTSLYVYWAMPEDSDYQVNYIIINDKKYENGMRVLDTNGNYRKYVFLDFEQAPDNQYEVTEVGFQNPEGKKIKYTIKINCKMGNDNGQYFFDQEMENKIVLVGMLLESIYQFDNEKGTIKDAWNNLWNNIDKKDGDQRSFYYFAFNCFDREIDHYFTPDEITKIVIDYTIDQYQFNGDKKDYVKSELVRREQKIQIVTPETIHVEAKNERNSNGKAYEYNTIYKLVEADISADNKNNNENEEAANHNTLLTAQQAGYEWVVHFGDTQGYRYSYNFTRSKADVDFTKVEDFNAISMSYIYKGISYSTATDTLVDMEIITQREKDHTEKLVKQFTDSVSFTAESLGKGLAGIVSTVVETPFAFLKGILKKPLFRVAFIIVAIPTGIFAISKAVKIIRKIIK